MPENILFIINSIIKKSKKRRIAELVAKYLDLNKFNYTIEYTEYRRHAAEIVKEKLDLFDIFVAIGGDGTVNEVAGGLIGTGKKLGIVPCGSGNGLARHLKISFNLKATIRRINSYDLIIIDTIRINELKFLNMAGVGFDAMVAEKFDSFGRRGLLTYIYLVIRELIKYRIQSYDLFIDGKEQHENAFLISFANSSQFGNNACISPYSDLTDGLVEVCILNKFPFYYSPVLALRLFLGNFDRSKYFKIIPARNVTISSPDPLKLHVNGDPVKTGNLVTLSVDHLSLNVIV